VQPTKLHLGFVLPHNKCGFLTAFYYTVVKNPLLSCDDVKPEHSHTQQDAQHKNNESILQSAVVEKRHALLAVKICAQAESWKVMF
jgi:hypothetical protein